MLYTDINFKDKSIYSTYKRIQYEAIITKPALGTRVYNKTRDTVSIVTEEKPYLITGPANERYVVDSDFIRDHYIIPPEYDTNPKFKKKYDKKLNSSKGVTLKSVENDTPFYAVKIPEDQIFFIYDEYGEKQQGNFLNPSVNHDGGDYAVCHRAKTGGPDFDRMFVVNGELFSKTYKKFGV